MSDAADRTEVVALARAIRRRMLDWEEAHGQAFKIDDTLSRILENDPDYTPYRKRKPGKQRGPAVAPSVFTVRRIAEKLGTTVGDLLGEREFDLTMRDRRQIRDALEVLRQRLALDAVDDVAPQPLGYRFPVPYARFREGDFDYPQPLHAWIVPVMPMAAGEAGVDSPTLSTEVLHSTRDVHDSALQVVRVIGDSMEDLLLDGYKVLVDTRLKKPRNGDVVAVYVKREGSAIGYWREEPRGKIVLDKHNRDYDPVPLGHHTEWFVVGTIVKIVEAPLPRMRS